MNARFHRVWLLVLVVAVGTAAVAAAVVTATFALATRPSLVKLAVSWPGASPEEMDQLVAQPLLRSLAAERIRVAEVVSISGQGECEIYLRSGGKTGEFQWLDAVRRAIDRSLLRLPADVDSPRIALLPPGSRIPAVESSRVPRLRVEFDRERLGALGMSPGDAALLLEKAVGDDSEAGWKEVSPETVLTSHEGVEVRLSDVAEIRVESVLNYVVRSASWQDSEQGGKIVSDP